MMEAVENDGKEYKYSNTKMCSGEILTKMEPLIRDTDVITATIPKTGQTWTNNILYHLKTKGNCADMEGKNLMEVVPWLEIPYKIQEFPWIPYDVDERIQQLESLESPRIFKMHVTWEDIPRPPNSKAKIITITRDMRDLPYSMYRHSQMMVENPNQQKFDTFEEFFEVRYMKFFLTFAISWINSFWAKRDDPDLLWLKYEEMKADTKRTALKIVKFIGWELSDEDVDKALNLCTFDHMQKTEKTVMMKSERSAFRKDSSFIREGKVGENRKKLSEDMEKRLVEKIRRGISEDAFKFLFPDL